MIAVEVRQPDLPDFTLLEQSVEQCLLFLVWRRRIDHDDLIAANDVAVTD